MERDINSLVLEEIEEITILKDAAALAPYGIRGANGVILVKTKRGKKGKTDIHVSYQHSVTTPVRLPQMADAATYAEAVNEGLANEGLAPKYTQQEIEAYRSGKYPTLFPNVDWFNETLRDHGQRDQVNFTASGGSNRIRYYSMINFISDRGLLKNTDQGSYSTQLANSILNVRTNLDIDITSSTRVKVNLSGKLKENILLAVFQMECSWKPYMLCLLMHILSGAITVFGGDQTCIRRIRLPSHHRQDIPHLMPVHYWRI